MVTLIIATRNEHKVREIQAVLSEGFEYRTLNDFKAAPAVVEDASSFTGNAIKKAVQLASWISAMPLKSISPSPGCAFSDVFCMADDSGLEVDVLGGAPGVRSARFAALDTLMQGNSSDESNNAKLLRLLNGVPREKRTARFRCCIALTPVIPTVPESASPVCYLDEAEMQTELFDGACEGRIEESARGTGGFGYDPLFVPEGLAESFAELGPEVKNRISHRAQALEKVRRWFQRQGGKG